MPQLSHPDQISLAIYNQGTSLVRERRTVDLQAGVNTLDFTDVTAQIDATSVTFTSLTDPDGTTVLEQNFLYDLVGITGLLKRYLEQTIEVTAEDGTRFVGQLIGMPDMHLRQFGADESLILRQSDGQLVYVDMKKVRDIRFPSLPAGLITRPTLRWLLRSARAGSQQVELTYLTGGLNWTADYNLLLATDNGSFDLSDWVTFANTSGGAFTDAQVKLVAGEVKRLPPPERGMKRQQMALGLVARGAPPEVEEREFFEYQLYEIKRPVTLAHNETKQVEFLTRHSIPARTFYIYDGSAHYFAQRVLLDEQAGQSNITHIQTWLEFSTGAEGGLDADLPAGRARVYQNDVDGAAVLIGENQVKHTPKGERVEFELGKAFDLVGERKQVAFKYINKQTLEESFAIHLRSRKNTETVTIRVPERLFRWSNWEITAASHAYTRKDAHTIEFQAEVAPSAEVVITYTVRYSWPK